MAPKRKHKTADATTDGMTSSDDMSMVSAVNSGSPTANVGTPKRKPRSVDSDEIRAELQKISGVNKKKIRNKKEESPEETSQMLTMKAVGQQIMEVLLDDQVSAPTAKRIVALNNQLEIILMSLIGENERLKGRLEAMGRTPLVNPPTVSDDGKLMPPPRAPRPIVAKPAPKPVETWSVVVRSKNVSATPADVVKQVVSEVGPSLGVRIHEVKPIRGGGAVIRTPSRSERDKLTVNAKFNEVGLDVSVNDKLGPKVVVQGVHSEISPDDFMTELYELNFKEKMSLAEFKKKAKLVSKPWQSGSEATINVVLEGTSAVANTLLESGRCYIKWFSFRVRPFHIVPGCYRCMGFDHRVADCKAKEDVCRRCGKPGHRAAYCVNAMNCRNCAFKGRASSHLMMSDSCPIYSGVVARALARH